MIDPFDEEDDGFTLPPLDPLDQPVNMRGVVDVLVATLGVALAAGLTRSYLLGAARAGHAELPGAGRLPAAIEAQHGYLGASLGPDLLDRLDAAGSIDEVSAAFDSLEARAEMYAGSSWAMYQAAFKDFGMRTQQVQFQGPDDERTCAGCQEAVEGNPYMLDSAPEPGSFECMMNCRHELIPLEEGELDLEIAASEAR
ncbi:MAG: hypothetical protein M3O91_10220 [Chloroflexota bacterium]|nr:hypothetical protein [Chloroflexota bacterium]